MPFLQQVAVLVLIAVIMTVGVYGLVAGIVKIDDAGLYLTKKSGGFAQGFGRMLLALAPRLMKFLSVVGTAAMFMVGGGIVAHNWELLHHYSEGMATSHGRGAGHRRRAACHWPGPVRRPGRDRGGRARAARGNAGEQNAWKEGCRRSTLS
jgi:predicted DNA repair protein MutK